MKKRRKRGTSLNAEIQASARQIYATGMAEAVRAAALGICARKLDEIKAILNAAGLQNVVAVPAYAPMGQQPVARPAQPTGPSCAICGNAAVRQARRNAYTAGQPAWYCRVHQSLAGQVEAEDARDAAIIGAPAQVVKKSPVVIQTNAPAVMRPQVEVAEPEPPAEESPSDALKEALGLAQ